MKPELTSEEKARAVRDYARGCNGSLTFYRHGLMRSAYFSDGAKVLAETCGAYWLIDAIVSYLPGLRDEPFTVWRLNPYGENGAQLTCDDGNDNILRRQAIPYTDFPRSLMPFKLYAEQTTVEGKPGITICLPEER